MDADTKPEWLEKWDAHHEAETQALPEALRGPNIPHFLKVKAEKQAAEALNTLDAADPAYHPEKKHDGGKWVLIDDRSYLQSKTLEDRVQFCMQSGKNAGNILEVIRSLTSNNVILVNSEGWELSNDQLTSALTLFAKQLVADYASFVGGCTEEIYSWLGSSPYTDENITHIEPKNSSGRYRQIELYISQIQNGNVYFTVKDMVDYMLNEYSELERGDRSTLERQFNALLNSIIRSVQAGKEFPIEVFMPVPRDEDDHQKVLQQHKIGDFYANR